MEYRILFRTALLNTSTVGHPVLNASGDLEQFVGTTIDITERKRAESLASERGLFSRNAEAEPQGSWAFNATTALYWSEENFRIWGFDPQQGLPDRERRCKGSIRRIAPEASSASITQRAKK